MIPQIDKISTTDLIQIYSQILTQLMERKVIRTKNLIGDMGEYLVIDHYNKTPGLPKLTIAPSGTKSIDAISREGKRYAIKSATSSLTGVFYGLNPPNSAEPHTQIFDYLIVAIFGNNFNLSKIIELTWEQFLEFKKWHSTMSAWNITITKKVLAQAKLILNTGPDDIEMQITIA